MDEFDELQELAAEEPEPVAEFHHEIDVTSAGGGDGESSGAGEAAAAASGESAVPVVEGGEVVGTAHIDPVTGVFQIDGSDTTVIDVAAPGPEPTGNEGAVGAPSETAAPLGGQDEPSMAPFAPHGRIPPEVFEFVQINENSRQTNCVAIAFSSMTPGGLVTVQVGVRVTAPIELRDGRKISLRQAQLDSSSAATATAELVSELLTTGVLAPVQVPGQFPPMMRDVMKKMEIGYRVQRCTPTP